MSEKFSKFYQFFHNKVGATVFDASISLSKILFFPKKFQINSRFFYGEKIRLFVDETPTKKMKVHLYGYMALRTFWRNCCFAFYVSMGIFLANKLLSEKIYYFFAFFLDFEKLRSSVENCTVGCQFCFLPKHSAFSGPCCFFLRRNIFLPTFINFRGNLEAFRQQFFGSVVETSFYVSIGTLRLVLLFRFFYINVWDIKINSFWLFSSPLSASFSNLESTCSWKHLEVEVIFEKNEWHNWNKWLQKCQSCIYMTLKAFWGQRSFCILLVHGNMFSKHVFLEKISYFILSSHREKKSEFFDPCQKLCERNILASWHKKSSKSAKLLSICSYEQFQEIQFYGKVYIFIIIFG